MVGLKEAVDLLSIEGKYDLRLKGTSYLGLTAGDMISFSYLGVERFGFLMKSGRTGIDGIFGSVFTRNTLMNFVSAEAINGDQFIDVVNKLYDNEVDPIVSNFSYLKGSGSTITNTYAGRDKFRTMSAKILSGTSIYILDIRKKSTQL